MCVKDSIVKFSTKQNEKGFHKNCRSNNNIRNKIINNSLNRNSFAWELGEKQLWKRKSPPDA